MQGIDPRHSSLKVLLLSVHMSVTLNVYRDTCVHCTLEQKQVRREEASENECFNPIFSLSKKFDSDNECLKFDLVYT
jgi:hypothetical protein